MKTRIFTLLMAFLATLSGAVWGQEPMEIRSWEDFLAFRDAVKENPNTDAILMNDIMANENILGEDGLPNIKYEEGSGHHDYQDLNLWSWKATYYTYSGTFDGNGYKISGIFSNADPLFGTLTEEAVVKNLTVTDSYFRVSLYDISVFAETNRGTISNCISEATIEADDKDGSYAKYVGKRIAGICGTNEGIIEDCINRGLIKADLSPWEGIYNIAGICGTSSGIIRRCINECNFDIQHQKGDNGGKYPHYFIGGILGNWSNSSNTNAEYLLEECYNSGDILVHGGENKSNVMIVVGGIIGHSIAYDKEMQPVFKINSCYNTGSLTIKDLNCNASDWLYAIGGIGGTASVFSNCYNIGDINAEDKTATFQNAGNLGSAGDIFTSAALPDPQYFDFENSYYKKYVDALCWYFDIENFVYKPVYEVKGAKEATDAQFVSGEVAWLLHKGGYGQRIGTDEHPVLISLGNEGTEVYKLVLSSEEVEVEADAYPTYVNAGTEITPFEDLTLEEGKTIGWYKEDDLVATGLIYIVNSADADEDAAISLTAKVIDEPEEEPEQPGGEGDDEQGGITPDYPKYYNIYEDEICEGVTVEFSRDVVKEGQSVLVTITVDEEFDATDLTLKFKRSLFGYWEDLTLTPTENPNEYIIKNIYTDIYVRAEGAVPTGIEDIEGAKVYTKDGSIYVQTPTQEQVQIISASGAVLKNEQQVGLKQYTGLQRGIYIIGIGEARFKVRL